VILAAFISAAITFGVYRRFLSQDAQGIFKTFAVFVFAWGLIGVTFRIVGLSLLRVG
jgi:hypothetical protein